LVALAVLSAGVGRLAAFAEPDAPNADAARPAGAQPAGAAPDFRKEVEPIFARRCARCHGDDMQEGGLRLDRRESALRGGDSGPTIVPGKPAESELIRRITSQDEDVRMPPATEKDSPLPAEEVALLTAWIAKGASWPADPNSAPESRHWSFEPIRREAPPDVQAAEWTRTPLDRFVLKRLEEQNIAPSPEADRYTLIRRVYYDLLGLPPTVAEVDAFVDDPSPTAYEALVDRVLASPHFGERWGRDWLDKARYADSDGYEKDNPRLDAWRYRDWVIRAVNDDMPFDQFTIEQLAGDLLPDATARQLLATAFHRQTLTNTEGGTDQEQFRVEAVFDRVNTTGTVWLGLTVGCAQCHSHKYDPISQREYYQLFAFFNNGDETTTDVPISDAAVVEYQQRKRDYDAESARLKRELDARRSMLLGRLAAWEQGLSERLQRASAQGEPAVAYHRLHVESARSEGKAELRTLDDGSVLASGKAPAADTYTLLARADVRGVTGFRLTALADESLPGKGPGRASNGNFVLSELTVEAADSEKAEKWTPVPLGEGQADFAQDQFPQRNAVDGSERTGWAVAPRTGGEHHAIFLGGPPQQDAAKPLWLRIVLKQAHGETHTLGRFRIEAMTGNDPRIDVPERIQAVLAVANGERTDAQSNELLEYFASLDQEYRELSHALRRHEENPPSRPVMAVRVIRQRTKDPRTSHLLRRGDFLQPQAEVVPATLAVLPPLKPRRADGPTDRLDLARWLVDPANPLTPRVAVNQIWAKLFGRGLVATVDDFGSRGEKPTHPELLDWLAREYMERGWSRKALLRLILTSAVYRQSSHHRPELESIDPQNTLLGRQNRLRVEAEIVRDVHLSVAGLLARKIGGPSVFPPMPPDVAALSYANNFKWNTSEGLDRYRRGMYTFFKRTAPHPNLTTFDCPDSNTTTVVRSSSNTPLQALTTLNNELFTEAAQALMQRLLDHPAASDVERFTSAFRACVARPPAEAERASFMSVLAAGREWYAAHPDEARQAIGPYQPRGASVEEAAAWLAAVRVLTNMDEFITRE